MRTIPGAVQTHLDDYTALHQIATYADFGSVRLTDYWENVTGPNGIYLAVPGYVRSAFVASLDQMLSTVSITTIDHASGITAAAARGLPGSECYFGVVCPGFGYFSLMRGNVGRVQIADYAIEIEMRGMIDRLRTTAGAWVGSAGCPDGPGAGSGSDIYVPGAEAVTNP